VFVGGRSDDIVGWGTEREDMTKVTEGEKRVDSTGTPAFDP
jgi:hypothetical protein